jgi:transposase
VRGEGGDLLTYSEAVLDNLDRQICQIERRSHEWMKDDRSAKAIAAIPGVGLLTATAAVATMGHAKAFKSGREFAAWLGLVPYIGRSLREADV